MSGEGVAQNHPENPRGCICKSTESWILCDRWLGCFPRKISRLAPEGVLHGVQGVECSNHSVPTKFEKAGSAMNRPFCIFLSVKIT